MIITIETLPSYKIAYMRRIGPYGNENKETMEKLKNWARANNLFDEESIILGIAQDNPAITPPENCRYDTCFVILDDYFVEDNGISIGNIVGGRYAVFKVEHTEEAIQKAWIGIFPELAKQNYEIDESRPIIERYAVKMINDHYCEICVPVC